MSVSRSKFIENRKLYIAGAEELKTNFLFIKEDDSFLKNARRLGRSKTERLFFILNEITLAVKRLKYYFLNF